MTPGRWLAWRRAVLPICLVLLFVAACNEEEQQLQPLPDGDVPIEYDRKAIREANVVLHSCGVRRGTIQVAELMLHYEQVVMLDGLTALYKGLHICALQAKGDCDKVRACYGVKTNKDGVEACNSSYQGACDGDVARYCEAADKMIVSIDCKAGGMTCHTDSHGHPFCGAGACTKDGEIKCEGTVKKTCNGSGWDLEHCELYELTCGLDRDSLLDCIGTGKECKG